MFAAIRNNDRVGLALFTDNVERFIPARKGRKHVLKLIRELLHFQPESILTDIDTSLRYISKITRKRSIIFVISDFMSDSFDHSLKMLRKKNDVICVNIRDDREESIPDVGYIMLEDEESGEQVMVNTSDPEFRKEYRNLAEKSSKELDMDFKRTRTDVINLRSDEELVVPLKKFFRLRMRRVR